MSDVDVTVTRLAEKLGAILGVSKGGEETLTLEEIAALLKISKGKAWELVATDPEGPTPIRIPKPRPGVRSMIRVRVSEFNRWLKKMEVRDRGREILAADNG